MAVITMPQSTTLGIKVQTGTTAAGAPAYKTVNFNSVKPAATDADIYAIAQGIAGLQTHSIIALSRVNNANLVEE